MLEKFCSWANLIISRGRKKAELQEWWAVIQAICNYMPICSYTRAQASPTPSLQSYCSPSGFCGTMGEKQWLNHDWCLCCWYPLQYLYRLCLTHEKALWNIKFLSWGQTVLQDQSCYASGWQGCSGTSPAHPCWIPQAHAGYPLPASSTWNWALLLIHRIQRRNIKINTSISGKNIHIDDSNVTAELTH